MHGVWGSLEILDPIHNQCLRLCVGVFRTSLVDILYVDAHENNLGARRLKFFLQYNSIIKSIKQVYEIV